MLLHVFLFNWVRVNSFGLPGAPYKMEPMADDANLFHSLSASNQASRDPDDEVAKNARQLVEKTFRFTANDCKGNMAGRIKCVGWWGGGRALLRCCTCIASPTKPKKIFEQFP